MLVYLVDQFCCPPEHVPHASLNDDIFHDILPFWGQMGACYVPNYSDTIYALKRNAKFVF